MSKKWTVASRASELALKQTEIVIQQLKEAFPDDEFEIRTIKTHGDLNLHKDFSEFKSKGIFCKNLEEALLRGEVDFCVHSLKDMPVEPDPLFYYPALLKRGPAGDILLSHHEGGLSGLPCGAVVGTSSPRRKLQLLHLRPDLSVQMIRGNLLTRLRKLREGEFDAIILAKAGLVRLSADLMNEFHCTELPLAQFIPAAGQGIIAVEALKSRSAEFDALTGVLDDTRTRTAYEAERQMMIYFEAGCRMPLSAYAEWNQADELILHVFNGSLGYRRARTFSAMVNTAGTLELSDEKMHSFKRDITGKVSFVGIGPGAADLLTLRAAKALQKADVLVMDRLGSEEIHPFFPEEAERIYVGKAAGHHTVRQEDINRILVRKAKLGLNVCRLKGGDPFVYGRGGEEAEALDAADISYEFIPGISSCLAVPELMGIPLTHRGYSSSFQVLTAHDADDKEKKEEILPASGCTVLFLMGSKKLAETRSKLRKAGYAEDCPVAFLERGSSPDQRRIQTTVGRMTEDGEAACLKSPVIILCGKTAALDYSSYEKPDSRPLKGVSVWLTSSIQKLSGYPFESADLGEEPKNFSMASHLRALGAKVMEVPLIYFRENEHIRHELDEKLLYFLSEPGPSDWVILRSIRALDAFIRSMKRSHIDFRQISGLRFAVTGPATAKALEHFGLYADLIPHIFSSAGLAEELCPLPPSRFFMPVGQLADHALGEKLEAAGHTVTAPIAYETLYRTPIKEELCHMSERCTHILLASSSAVESLAKALENAGISPESFESSVEMLAIGPKTAARAAALGFTHPVSAEEASPKGLAECLIKRHQKFQEIIGG